MLFTACLRNTTGTDIGVIICPSGLFCFYSPSRFRDICGQGLWRGFSCDLVYVSCEISNI